MPRLMRYTHLSWALGYTGVLFVKWFPTAALSALILIMSGCASTQNDNQSQWVYPPMAVPLQSSLQQQVQIARLTQLLQRTDLPDDVRAKMFYERGNNYDSVGLRTLARLDFEQSLAFNPAQPDIFNLLGVYYTQVAEFDAAYEAFDSTLELEPDNFYAERNRAIALYYGDRTELALEEIRAHYQHDPSDPFRALWLYIIQSESEPLQARVDLFNRYKVRDDQWGWLLVALTLKEISEEQAFKMILEEGSGNAIQAQRLTEVYFYLAKRYQQEGNYAHAIALYKLALSFNVYEYVEHRYAYLELGKIFQQVRADYLAKAKSEQPESQQ
ncbi:lipoprotein NlpI [Vibrio sp. B4-12]|nr:MULTISPECIES: lipoprotein NlpI [unclassified Vibrio]MDQ2190563.1 lipoprotein NlpI [Vibrio sp. A14(2019)]MDQ2195958.1 lipoprotein NlpI [Vibrio sp. 2017_1457_11]NNN75176.1 lipoprotein NlpI [Vibrio sp. B7]NNN91699.1 lipoprotein NlpI [Vibrio sp. B8-1]NNO06999.1 lipoprotein NlpI [Vibrio sp. B4-12]